MERFFALKECVDDLMAIENGVPDKNLALIGRWREVPDFPDEQTEFPDNETPQELQARWEFAVSVAERKLNWEEEEIRLGQTSDDIEERKKQTSSDRIVALQRDHKLFHTAGTIMRDMCIPCFWAGFYTEWYPTGDL